MKQILTTLLCVASMGWMNAAPLQNEQIEKRIAELLSQMTIEEKIGQMNQVNGRIMSADYLKLAKEGAVGSVLNVENRDDVNKLQEAAMKGRLGIPLLVGRDVIHGYKTIFPIPLGQAATFNPEVVYRGARIAAIEASGDGIRWTFAPMIDIARDARWGRIAESLGEDTYLTSVLGAEMVKGFQGGDLTDPTSMAACAKHFVGYGASEAGKDYAGTNIPERQMRNVYLPPFKAAVEAGVLTFMTSFNDNDGIPASGNRWLLTSLLRGEWGFEGLVVSDWGAVTEMVNHRFARNNKEAAMKAVNAGVDMEMVSGSYRQHLRELINEGAVTLQQLNTLVANILRVKMKLGLFDNPYLAMKSPRTVYLPEHLEAARKAAEESVILLKNSKETLPLTRRYKKIAVIGPLANAPHDQLGTWVFDGEKEQTITPLMALNEKYGKEYKIRYAKGLEFSRDVSDQLFKEALNVAKEADIILYFGGEESILSGEAHSLADISLKGAQSRLVDELANVGKPLVVVLMAGRPMTIEREVEAADALLYAFHPGTMGGPALADILFGKVVPSGKLPVTMPRMVGQCPIYYNHFVTGRPASGKELLLHLIPLEAKQTSTGCTSFYLDAGFGPLFPFGFGLSYTTFRYSNLRLRSTSLGAADVMVAEVELTNIGTREATEVVQVYASDLSASVSRPIRELVAFERVTLGKGERRVVRFEVPVARLSFWRADMTYGVEPGEHLLMVGGNSQEGLTTSFEVK